MFYSWNRRATATFERHSRVVRLELIASESQTIQRVPLFEPTLEGESWDTYAPILLSFRDFPGKWTWPVPPAEEHERLLVQCRPLMNGLREALSKPRIRFPSLTDVEASNKCSRLFHAALPILFQIAEGYHARLMNAEALDTLIILLGVLSDWRHLPGDGIWPTRWTQDYEMRALQLCRQVLSGHSSATFDLSGTIVLVERLRSSRPVLHKNVAAHGILWRRYILEWERQGIREFPYDEMLSWRFAFSARLGRASALDAIEVIWRRLQALESVSSCQWVDAFNAIYDEEYRIAVAKPLDDIRPVYGQEVGIEVAWTLFSISMATARFELAEGHPPASLDDLSPKYLGMIPACPHGAEPLVYKDGATWCQDHSQNRWKVCYK
jgi:hypothetical protein